LLGRRQDFLIGRAQYSLGRSSYAGAIVTDTEFGIGHNRVLGGDLSIKQGEHRASATFLSTTTRSPDGQERKDGLGGQAFYGFETKRFAFYTQVEHYDRGFQMDTAFLNQVGITQGWTFVAPSFYPDPKKHAWFKRFVPFVFAQYGKDRIQGGIPWIVVPGVRMHFTRQGFLRIDTLFGQEPWVGRTFHTSNTRLIGEAQLTRWLHLSGQAAFGRAIFYDLVNPFLGRRHTYNAEVTLQPTARFKESVSYNRVALDRLEGGPRVYTVDVLNTKTTFQVDRRFSVRGIVQYESSHSRVLTDLLACWELRPGTVAYAGYGSLVEKQDWDGTRWVRGQGSYTTTNRGFFFKASYIHRF
jgi:hypothetical protein